MPRYLNGQIPADALVTFASGTNEDGYWEHRLPPSTYRKHLALVRLGEQRHGRTLRITPGYNGYRPLDWQWIAYRNEPAGNAAYPGTSSHGGSYQGVDMAAMDYGNWQWVWGSFDAFAAACREVGLEAGLFPWEPWHVIDRDPWAPIPAGGGAEPLTITKEGDGDVATFVRTPQHGHYSVAPGVVVGIGDPTFIDRVVYVAKQAGTTPPTVLDVAPDDLPIWLFNLSGIPRSQIPPANYAWFAARNPTQ